MTLYFIDENRREEHIYLDHDDECFYIYGEHIARAGYAASPTNQLISNIKKEVSKRGTPEYFYKERDIIQVANLVKEALGNDVLPITVIPVPPSKAKDDPEYDNRILLCLGEIIKDGWDVRELIVAKASMRAHHEHQSGEKRPTPDELYQMLMIDETCFSQKPIQQKIILFDDVLTNGTHFKACKRLLLERLPESKVYGLFIARTIHLCPFSEILDT